MHVHVLRLYVVMKNINVGQQYLIRSGSLSLSPFSLRVKYIKGRGYRGYIYTEVVKLAYVWRGTKELVHTRLRSKEIQ